MAASYRLEDKPLQEPAPGIDPELESEITASNEHEEEKDEEQI